MILSPARFAESIREQGISTMFLTAPLFRLMATMTPDAFGGMKTLVVGGDAVDPDAARKVLRTAPPRFLVNGYGPTEATTFSVCHLIEDVPEGATLDTDRKADLEQRSLYPRRRPSASRGRRIGRALPGGRRSCSRISQPARAERGKIRRESF